MTRIMPVHKGKIEANLNKIVHVSGKDLNGIFGDSPEPTHRFHIRSDIALRLLLRIEHTNQMLSPTIDEGAHTKA